MKKQYVDIIASGYEWICPKCETWNDLKAIPKAGKDFYSSKVICKKCHRVSYVDTSEVNHAYD